MARQLKCARRWLSLGLVAVACTLLVLDASAATKPRRILLVGDSWPYFMWGGAPFWNGCAAQDGLDQAGYSKWAVYGGDTAVPMSMAREWRDNLGHVYQGHASFLLDIIRAELVNNPTLDIAHVSLGGNDIGRGYYNDVMPQQIRFTGTATSGTFTLHFEGQETAALPYNATAAQIQAAMVLLPNIGAGKIQVTGPDGGPYMCVFDQAIVGFIGEATKDNNISVSSSLVGGGVMVDESHHGWQQSWGTDSAYEKLFFDAVCFGIEKVIRTLLDVRPDIRVALCDYDYLRIDWGGATELETRITGMRLGMEKFRLTQRISAMPEYLNRCFYIAPAGLMQYVFGLYSRYKYCAVGVGDPLDPCTDAGPAPGAVQLYGPMGTAGTAGAIERPKSNLVKWGITEPMIGGNIDPPVDYYPDDRPDPNAPNSSPHQCDISPRNTILANWGGGDIHLNNLGYAALMKYSTEEFYGEWLDYPRVLSVAPMPGKWIAPDLANEKAGAVLAVFQITFSEDVKGVDMSDFVAVTHGSRAGASIVSVEPDDPSGYYATYTVTVDCGSGSGTVTVDVIDNNTIKDQDGISLAGNIDGHFSSGVLYNPSSHTLPVSALPAAAILACLGAWVMKRRGY